MLLFPVVLPCPTKPVQITSSCLALPYKTCSDNFPVPTVLICYCFEDHMDWWGFIL